MGWTSATVWRQHLDAAVNSREIWRLKSGQRYDSVVVTQYPTCCSSFKAKSDYVVVIDKIAQENQHNCGGLDMRGNGFGFYNCSSAGSPWCELDLKV